MSCSFQRDDSPALSRGVSRRQQARRSVHPQQPLILLADSRLLFPATGGELFLAQLRRRLPAAQRAVYFGASNGDAPEFFELFQAAMNSIGIYKCRHCPAQPSAEDLAALAVADLIFLAGGDPILGWHALLEQQLDQQIRQRFQQGAQLIGLSAGAIQLGVSARSSSGQDIGTFGLLSFLVDAHQEPDWHDLESRVRDAGPPTAGIGIPTGGGLVVHEDGTLEAIAQPVTRLDLSAGELQRTHLPPQAIQSV